VIRKIYSNVDKEKLLFVMYDLNSVTDRVDLVDDNEFLQCAVIKKPKNTKFRPHKHISKPLNVINQIAQESWLVFKGKIKVYHYDIDDSFMGTHDLSEGEIHITLEGGHSLECLEDNTIICEHKNGPYYGQKLDKTFIGDNT